MPVAVTRANGLSGTRAVGLGSGVLVPCLIFGADWLLLGVGEPEALTIVESCESGETTAISVTKSPGRIRPSRPDERVTLIATARWSAGKPAAIAEKAWLPS